MIKPILISIIPPTIIAAPWFLGSKLFNLISEPVALILCGLILIGLANIGKNKLKKN
jgi:undecaprenyl pyrophosphate phosphatase UppP